MAGGRGKVADTLAIEATSASALVVGGAPGASSGTGGIKAGAIVSSSSVSDSVGTMATMRAGGISIASQAALDFLFATSASQLGRLAKGTGLQVPRVNAGATAYEFYTPSTAGAEFLKGDSGTHVSASAANVSTVALASGLTIKDSLLVLVSVSTVTQNTAASLLQNSTDSVTVHDLNSGSVYAAGIANRSIEMVLIRAEQTSSILIQEFGLGWGNGGTIPLVGSVRTFTTAWTGAWTLALRLGAVTAGGSCGWSWGVYRFIGQ